MRAILRSLAADEAAGGTEQSPSINCTLEKYAMSYHIGVVRALGSSRVQVHIEQGYRSSSASHRFHEESSPLLTHAPSNRPSSSMVSITDSSSSRSVSSAIAASGFCEHASSSSM